MTQEQLVKEQLRAITRQRVPRSNLSIAKTLLIFSTVCLGVFGLFQFGLLKSKGVFVSTALVILPAIFITVSLICLACKGQGKVFQYLFFTFLIIFWLALELMSGYKCKMLLPILIILSLRYYNKWLILFTLFAGVAALFGSVWANAYLYAETELIDLNTVLLADSHTVPLAGFIHTEIINLAPDSATLLYTGLMLSFLPNVIFLIAITVIAIRFMNQNMQIILAAEQSATRGADQRVELVELKTKNMLSQVKPHFIYNTLTGIAQLCTEDPARAKKLTVDFADYLRNHLDTLNDQGLSVCTFAAELSHIKSYLNIEQVRFEDTLQVEYDIQTQDFNLPALCVQPIVENAVKHGISKKVEGGTVKIATRRDADGVRIVISDDGIGFDPATPPADGKTHTGMENIQKRLALFGGSFTVQSTPGAGTVATVFLPKKGD